MQKAEEKCVWMFFVAVVLGAILIGDINKKAAQISELESQVDMCDFRGFE